MNKARLIIFAVLVADVSIALVASAKGILPCMVYRHGLTPEQIDYIMERRPDSQLRLTAQDWRAMRYQLARFENMTNYVHLIGSTQDCERVLLALDDSVRALASASNRLSSSLATMTGKFNTVSTRYADLTNSYVALEARYNEAVSDFQSVMHDTVERYNAATNSLAAAEARAARAGALKSWLVEQRDKALLESTKKIYQAIIDRLEGDK